MTACDTCVVRNRAICASLDSEELKALNAIGRRRMLAVGESLMWEGEDSVLVANVVEGVLKLSTGTEDGREQIVGVVYPSEFIGRPFGSVNGQGVTALTDAVPTLDSIELEGSYLGWQVDLSQRAGGWIAVSRHAPPAVAARAEARFAAAGLGARARAVGGDFHAGILPEGADIISFVRVLHDHDEADVAKMLRAAHAALPADGTLLIAEPMAETRGAEAMGAAYFGFYLRAMGTGRPRSPEKISALLEAAGLQRLGEAAFAFDLLEQFPGGIGEIVERFPLPLGVEQTGVNPFHPGALGAGGFDMAGLASGLSRVFARAGALHRRHKRLRRSDELPGGLRYSI